MTSEPRLIRRDKATRDERAQGSFYVGTVTSVRSDNRVVVRIPALQVTVGPVMPINTTTSNKMSKGDQVLCAFTDYTNSNLAVFGTLNIKTDQYAPFESGVTRFVSIGERDTVIPAPEEGRVVYITETDELQIYNGEAWITVIDTGSSENISVDTLVANSASIGTLTVTGESTLNVLGASNLSASTTIGTITPAELSHLDGVTSGIQAQINAKAPSASPTFTGTVTLPSTTSIGSVSSTEIGYLDGVTSAIQNQLNAKAPSASPTFTGTVTLPSNTSIGNVSSTEISYLDGVTSAIQTQLDAKASNVNQTFTGTVTLPSTTSIGNVSSTEISYLDGVTSGIQSQLNGKANLSGATYTGRITINYGDPTIVFQDTDHRSGMLHCNSNLFYILRGDVNGTTWFPLGNGRWPFQVNLDNGYGEIGGDLAVHGGRVYASSCHLGYWGSDGNWAGVQGGNGYILLNNPNTSFGAYFRTYTGPVHLGGSGNNTVVITDVTYIGTNVNKTGVFCAMSDDMWFTDPQNGRIDIRNYANTDWGTSQGYYLYPSSIKFKKNIIKANSEELFNDAINSGIYEFNYNEDTPEHNRAIGPILEDSPDYFKRKKTDDGLFISSYVGMLHGAIKHMAKRIDELENLVGVANA